MNDYDLYIPNSLLSLLRDIRPNRESVDAVLAEGLEIGSEDLSSLARGLAWAGVKLTLENEILKTYLAEHIAKNQTIRRRRGRPAAKPHGLGPLKIAPRRPTIGAPPKHKLRNSTKRLALGAQTLSPDATPLMAARNLLVSLGEDVESNDGKRLLDNLRRRVSETRQHLNKKPIRTLTR